MASATHNGEWVVEAGLTERTGLSKGQIKSYRLNLWIEGVHFKHLTAQGEAGNPSGLLWYNYQRIIQLVQEA